MRWVLLLVSVFGFAIVFSTRSSALLTLGLLAGFGGLFGAIIGFASARIASTARPDSMLLSDKDIGTLQASIRKSSANPPRAPGA
ncbi:MAG TPA: hypothetical protein VFB32_02720 [Rudaea sp.]|nr:hypothetical protein [Rudaea sp.]